jgi:hypothetical protein
VTRALLLGVVAGLAFVGRDAAAQVRWDVGVAGGAAGRFLAARPPGEGEASAGPDFEAEGHVVVLPLVRLGGYLHLDESAVAGAGYDVTRDIFAGGLDLRLVSPWPRRDVRVYLRAGIGEARVWMPARGGAEARAAAAGYFTEAPLALGIAWRPYPPIWLTAEVGARVGFAFGGATYGAASVGEDLAAVYGAVGVMWGR